ncbi:MAG TPA: L-threonylcarbamoyladenylate synthase [Anaerohalosphaeraceae bacterium]|nr:L-threonylcarbamoyladenylate synthase [Anaerohalosphaeraceae bacterium]HOL87637.1 L-threonylcarbamoyladenylate synthase [Anaerohalosphaeraceae bacterium]HPP55856.1 L-threonylcarbamoyladenylate synthase [Anaerohalosphaeraceae bacterium]
MSQTRRPAVFLDRDGTLIEDIGYVRQPSEVVFYPETFEALRLLQEHFVLFIVTNQPGISQQILRAEEVESVNRFVTETLREAGIVITQVYVCPHQRQEGCQCIKPRPFYLQQAADDYSIDLRRSFCIGDHPHDIELAQNAGAEGVYVLTGHGQQHCREVPAGTPIVRHIGEAAEWILRRIGLKECLPNEEEIARAADCLRRGGLVAFPTETVYGLGADALNEEAVRRIFEVKRRPSFDPLIVHVGTIEQARRLVRDFPKEAELLAERFWPGPLTLVLPKEPIVPDIVTAGLPTAAIRMPAHPAALALLRRADVPVAAPSANLFGHVSPTCAEHVREQLGNSVDFLLDGGPCSVGVESTILSLAVRPPLLLRYGGISAEQIEEVIGPVQRVGFTEHTPQAPGRLEHHYAPRTPLFLTPELIPPPKGRRVGLLTLRPSSEAGDFAAAEVLSASGNLEEAARNLYAAMRRLDRCGLEEIIAVAVPNEGIGRTINDRLCRASWNKPKDILFDHKQVKKD